MNIFATDDISDDSLRRMGAICLNLAFNDCFWPRRATTARATSAMKVLDTKAFIQFSNSATVRLKELQKK